MSADAIKIKKMNVVVQENGIVRNSKGRIIARFIEDVEFYGEHIYEESQQQSKLSDDEIKEIAINLSELGKRTGMDSASVMFGVIGALKEVRDRTQPQHRGLSDEEIKKMVRARFLNAGRTPDVLLMEEYYQLGIEAARDRTGGGVDLTDAKKMDIWGNANAMTLPQFKTWIDDYLDQRNQQKQN